MVVVLPLCEWLIQFSAPGAYLLQPHSQGLSSYRPLELSSRETLGMRLFTFVSSKEGARLATCICLNSGEVFLSWVRGVTSEEVAAFKILPSWLALGYRCQGLCLSVEQRQKKLMAYNKWPRKSGAFWFVLFVLVKKCLLGNGWMNHWAQIKICLSWIHQRWLRTNSRCS